MCVVKISTDTRPIVYPTIDLPSTDCRLTIDRLSTDYRPLYRPLYRPIDRSTLPAVNKSQVFLNSGDVNVVCLYRSPSSTDEHDIAVRSDLHKLPTSDTDQVILLRDFNLPDVCWSNETVRGPIDTSKRRLLNQKKYIDCLVSCGLTWHIADEITRRRVANNKMQEFTLDQIFTSD